MGSMTAGEKHATAGELARRLARRLKALEFRILLALLVFAGGIWVFVGIADEVMEGEAAAFDNWVFKLVRGDDEVPPLWLTEIMHNITSLGSITVLTIAIGIVAGFLFLRGEYRRMLLILAAGGLGEALVISLKTAFTRSRPELSLPPVIAETSPGFPSGHAMMSALVYLSLAALLTRTSPDMRIRVYILAVGFALTFIIGVSRIYLGVHHPTDVLAGWAIGFAWACAWWLADHLFVNR